MEVVGNKVSVTSVIPASLGYLEGPLPSMFDGKALLVTITQDKLYTTTEWLADVSAFVDAQFAPELLYEASRKPAARRFFAT